MLVTQTAHGPRVDHADEAARAMGIAHGMLLADARTLCPQIVTATADPAGDLAMLERLALWARRWGPWSAIDPPDGLVVDITGAAHLFGGEHALLADVADAFSRRALSARAALAPTAGAAWALAHYGAGHAILSADDDPLTHLADLPVDALRLDPDVLLVLRRLGLKRIAQLGEVGRDSLQRRFRQRHAPAANPLLRLDQLLGTVPEPLLPVVDTTVPLVERRLLEPVRHRSLLDRIVEDLAHDMERELEGRGQGARRLELGLWLVDGEVIVRHLEMAAATRDAGHVCRLFASRLEGIDSGFGIELARLRAPWVQTLAMAQADMEAAAENHGTSLAACIDRLTVRLGAGAVRRPVTEPSHMPERAQGWAAPLDTNAAMRASAGPALSARPLKLLDRAEPIAVLYATPDGMPRRFRWRGSVREIALCEGPERIAPEWWRERSSARLRDYYRIEDGQGRRYWIYRNGLAGDGRGGAPQWFLHGFFA